MRPVTSMLPFALAVSTAALACSAPACSEAVAKSKAVAPNETSVRLAIERPVAVTPVEIAPITRAPVAVTAGLENPGALRTFYQSLAALEASRAEDDVRVLQFGDSHTAADIGTSVLRRALQGRFGDGGRGFVAIGRPYRHYLQDGVRGGMSKEWSPEHGKLEKGRFVGDGFYGLAGIGVETNKRGARAWADVTARTSRLEVAYLEQPRGGAFDVFVDGVRAVRVATKSRFASSAFRAFDVPEGTSHQIEVRAVGDGDVRVFGVSLDRVQHGVVVDALGINGARAATCLQWNETHFTEQVRHRNPSLVILAYGTNETGDETSPDVYERRLVDVLGRIARAVPAASCLLLGPPDRAIEGSEGWMTSTKLLEIIASQRRVAAAAGCAFYDQFTAMGGAGTIASWALEDPPRAQKDRVHLTREGYAQLGGALASDLMRGYAAWRSSVGLAPVESAP